MAVKTLLFTFACFYVCVCTVPIVPVRYFLPKLLCLCSCPIAILLACSYENSEFVSMLSQSVFVKTIICCKNSLSRSFLYLTR